MNTQVKYHLLPIKQLGFTLIEAMIAFAVAGIGILAVVSFQAELISTSAQSKARAEALQIAQSKLEEFKNFTFIDITAFNASPLYAATTYATTTDQTITGTNAVFTRDYQITANGSLRDIEVNVSWTDAKNVTQNVTLNTSLTYESQAVISAENLVEPPTVTSATGSATIGAGTVKCGAVGGPACNNNGDGTSIADDGGDLKLVIDDGNIATDDKVVLTLQDACVAGVCTQFVQIRGSVYVDTATQTTLAANDVKVLASDAAYCQRFYLSTSGTLATAVAASDPVVSNTASNVTTYYKDINGNGTYESGVDIPALTATTDITSPPSTASGDYDYYRYSCYLGGGWHGNIGILKSGGNADTDKFCLGDPNAIYEENEPVLAARRVYRGMTYKDVDANPLDNTSITKETYTLSGGGTDIRYYSQGIKDGALLDGQDFVIGQLGKFDTSGDYCVSAAIPATIPFTDNTAQARGIMTRADSTDNGSTLLTKAGSLFADVPADWVCLNQEGHKASGATAADPCLTGAANIGLGESSCYSMIDPVLPYGADYSCPYNPTSPPNTIYTVTGTLYMYPGTLTTADWKIGSYDATATPTVDTTNLTNLVYTDSANTNLVVNTSQSTGNCTQGNYTKTVGPPEYYSASYSCNIYDWTVSGWTGDIVASSDMPSILPCTSQSNLTISSNTSGVDIVCESGVRFKIGGSIAYSVATTTLTSADISMTALAADGGNGSCVVAADGLSYSCISGLMDVGTTTWSGDITVTSVADNYCYIGDGTLVPTDNIPNTLPTSPNAPVVSGNINYNGIDATINHTGESLFVDKSSSFDCI